MDTVKIHTNCHFPVCRGKNGLTSVSVTLVKAYTARKNIYKTDPSVSGVIPKILTH